MRGLFLSVACLGCLLFSGCGDTAAPSDEREERDPHVINARKLFEEGRLENAIAMYKKALENDPSMARPHLDMARTYQHLIENARAAGGDVESFVDNHIHAIYHYDRYLELRPDTEKAELLKKEKMKVVESLAVFLVKRAPQVKELVSERNTLLDERAELKRQLAAALQRQPAAAPASGRTVTRTVPKSAPAPTRPLARPSAAPAPKPARAIYHVVAGDNLYKIAQKHYNDSSKWDVIFEANRDTMRSPGALKVGQTLVIPALEDESGK